jgi:hypothetical protein
VGGGEAEEQVAEFGVTVIVIETWRWHEYIALGSLDAISLPGLKKELNDFLAIHYCVPAGGGPLAGIGEW